MPRTFTTQAFVIRRSNIGEADRLLTFFSKYKGKFTAIAKGVRKVSSRRAPNLELLNLVRVQLVNGKSLDLVSEVSTIDSFPEVKQVLEKMTYSLHLLELVNNFLADGQENRELFDLLVETLSCLKTTSTGDAQKFSRAFEMKILDHLGLRPELGKCVSCSEGLAEAVHFISPIQGGMLHRSCLREDLLARPLGPSSLKILRFLQVEPLQKIDRLILSDQLCKDLGDKTRFYLENVLEKKLKSLGVLDATMVMAGARGG